MLKTKFFVRHTSGEGVTPIYVRVTNGRAFDFKTPTKETCIASHWCNESGMMKERFFVEQKGKLVEKRDGATRILFFESREVNARLQELEKKIEKSFKESEGIEFDLEWLKNIINPPVVKENTIPDDFVAYCDVFTEQKKHHVGEEYLGKIKRTRDMVAEFLKYSKKKKLKFTELNQQFASDFGNYMIEVKKYSKNYVSTTLKYIRLVANHAEFNGIKLSPQIKMVKSKLEKTVFQILTPEELTSIENHNFEDSELDNIRDWLIISVYSAQRISDFMRFTTDMISRETNDKGKEMCFLNFTQDKTGHVLHLPVHPKILKILNKRDFQFPPKYDEDKYNLLVKTVCKDAGITEMCYGGIEKEKRKVFAHYPKHELITSHIGRRSFASNNYGKIPTPLLMKATGHKSEGIFLKYIGKVDNQQSHALASYFYD
ncbi:integrase [Chryseobacterium sp. CBo1]|uniref:phage integrase SAM-like domain-containing protein n=1 Tax=Chryseobacterium sp. CBo1 TaxID=1869230 RepID=UPI000810C042|nr:phage integrase SAM-like domain-containing protein [Chryseobacterium sp. CBo1]OCK51124.1 integrase [Chryseobacterium sp. CBo1]